MGSEFYGAYRSGIPQCLVFTRVVTLMDEQGEKGRVAWQQTGPGLLAPWYQEQGLYVDTKGT